MPNPNKSTLRFLAAYNVVSLIAFVVGYFAHIHWLLILGGTLLVLDDIMEMITGMLNPLFPIIAAIIVAILFQPWYIGVFWSIVPFKIVSLPRSIKALISTDSLLE